MKSKGLLVIMFLLVLGISLAKADFQQTRQSKTEGKKPISCELPVELCNKLVERMNLYIDYSANKQWDKLYYLLDAERRNSLTQEEFIQKVQYLSPGILLKVTVKEIYEADSLGNDPTWVIKELVVS